MGLVARNRREGGNAGTKERCRGKRRKETQAQRPRRVRQHQVRFQLHELRGGELSVKGESSAGEEGRLAGRTAALTTGCAGAAGMTTS